MVKSRTPVASRIALGLALLALPAFAASKPGADALAQNGRNLDRRVVETADAPQLAPAQAEALARWQSAVPSLLHKVDPTTGGLRSISNAVGYLTGPRAGDAESIALDFAHANLDLLGLTAADLDDYEVTDSVTSAQSGVTHLYLRQRHDGIPVYNAQLHFNIAADGSILLVNNQFVPGLAAALNATAPELSAVEAINAFAQDLGSSSFSANSGKAQLMILPIRPGEARLVWNFDAEMSDGQAWYDATVDALDGRVWTRFDWVADAQYRVYPTPVEHPGYAAPAPPADGRTTVVDPHVAGGTSPATGASPWGWHDTNGAAGAEFTDTQGNNVDAYTDTDANNTPDAGSRPSGGASLVFTPAIDLNQAPANNRPPAVVNLFYWNNIIHDIEYQYGFDEASGNFQVNNYGRGGAANDSVQAEAQDGSGTCNANFATPADGSRPRMQMYLSSSGCWSGTPARDGDLDNMVIVHEYGHGISRRLIGGPSNVSCMNNTEQPGEGTSDWWGLSLTATAAQTGPTVRGVGTWLFGNLVPQGIRPFPYSTDNGVNPHTYNSIAGGVAVPHGVGAVWAQGYWEAYWALVDEHGFDQDFYNFTGGAGDAGNIRAKYYMNEGMKNTACLPGFVDVRDGMLAAAAGPPYNGEDTCLLWEAFAGFGLGFSANQGSSGSITDQTEAFDIPTSCSFGNAGDDAQICAGQTHVQSLLVGPAFTSPPVDMSVSGQPAGTTAVFSEDPVSGPLPETITLTIGNTGGVSAGTYAITVTGNDGVNINDDTFDLTVDTAPAGATTLVSPANGATGVSTTAPLSWTAVAGAGTYDVEVDDNSNFSSPEFTATVPGTNVDATGLAVDTLYFWRVRANNGCGGTFTAARNFTTALEYCATPNLAIPDNGAAVTTSIVVPAGGNILDLDLYIRGNHTWVGDVTFGLSKDGGANQLHFNRPGVPGSTFGCSSNGPDITLDDESGVPVESACPTNDFVGTFSPNVPLSFFDGQSISGTWTLSADDNAGGDSGSLLEWCLLPTVEVDPMPFLDGFETGDTSQWSATQN